MFPIIHLADQRLKLKFITSQLSKALGNKKPASLVKIERLLWECVLGIATGREACYEALTIFLSKVDWDEIAMISEADRSHFANGVVFFS
jgi:hypothetical protein